ncbi:MAG: DUF535 family protein [Telluria sp.]
MDQFAMFAGPEAVLPATPARNADGSAPARPDWKERAKLALGALLYPRLTRRWRARLTAQPLLAALARQHPRMAYQIYRPYLSAHLGPAERAAALAAHYDQVEQIGWQRFILDSARAPVTLGRVHGKHGAVFALAFSTAQVNPREGECALQLAMDGAVLFTASFTFAGRPAARQLVIGSLQGLRHPLALDLLRQATRELHGARPVNVLLAVLRDLAAELGLSSVVLVGNRNRVLVHPRRRRQVHFDYDALAAELGGQRDKHGNHLLSPRPLADVDFAAIPSAKRAAARRRLQLLLALRQHWPAAPRSAPVAVAA